MSKIAYRFERNKVRGTISSQRVKGGAKINGWCFFLYVFWRISIIVVLTLGRVTTWEIFIRMEIMDYIVLVSFGFRLRVLLFSPL